MKVFFSYSRNDFYYVKTIAEGLRSANSELEVFIDSESIDVGDLWLEKIQNGIEQSGACLIFLGDSGLGSWQSKEILHVVNRATADREYKIIPVVISKSEKLASYQPPWFLSEYQWIGFHETDNGHAIRQLSNALLASDSNTAFDKSSNPYKGLNSFEIADANMFFGREYDLNIVFHTKLQLQTGIKNSNFLSIVADSGTGKSSFVKAGILAALENNKFPGSADWKQILIRPGKSPIMELCLGLIRAGLLENSSKTSREFENNILQHDDELFRIISLQSNTKILFIDQFEELVTQCTNEDAKRAFVNNITKAVDSKKLILIVAIRSDLFTSFFSNRDFKLLLETKTYILSGVNEYVNESARRLRNIITRPASINSVFFEPELVNKLIQDLRSVRGVLPVLQLALQQLWIKRKEKTLITVKDYLEISNDNSIEGIIQSLTDKAYHELTNNGNDELRVELFKRLFIPHLIEVTFDREVVRRTALKEHLLSMNGFSRDLIEEFIESLSGERFRLLLVKDSHDGASVEVTHEIIIREWPLLQNWIAERRTQIKYQQRLSNDAIDWKNGLTGLYSGKRLELTIKWSEQNADLVDQTMLAFIMASVDESKVVEQEKLERHNAWQLAWNKLQRKRSRSAIKDLAYHVFDFCTKDGNRERKEKLFQHLITTYFIEYESPVRGILRPVFQDNIVGINELGIEEMLDILDNMCYPDHQFMEKVIFDGRIKYVPLIDISSDDWPLLAEWIRAGGDDIAKRDVFLGDANRFHAGAGRIYRGIELRELRQWIARNPDLADKRIQQFFLKSRAFKTKILWWVGTLVSIILVVFFVSVYLTSKLSSPVLKEVNVSDSVIMEKIRNRIQMAIDSLYKSSNMSEKLGKFRSYSLEVKSISNNDSVYFIRIDVHGAEADTLLNSVIVKAGDDWQINKLSGE